MREFRVFISSPGDAAIERRRAEHVVSRLNGGGDLSGTACEIIKSIDKRLRGAELPPACAFGSTGEVPPATGGGDP